jgi:hypothetical protein
LDCHAKVSVKGGIGKKYSPREISKYKRNWEYLVRKRRKLIIVPESKSTGEEKNQIRIEVKKNVFEFAATNSVERANEILQLLDIYRIFEDTSGYILDVLYHVVPFIYTIEKQSLLAAYVLHYTWHLPGPEYTESPLRPEDVRDLSKVAELLSWMGKLNMLALREDSMDHILSTFYVLFDTATAYGSSELYDKIVQSLSSMKEGALESNMRRLAERIDSQLRKMNA